MWLPGASASFSGAQSMRHADGYHEVLVLLGNGTTTEVIGRAGKLLKTVEACLGVSTRSSKNAVKRMTSSLDTAWRSEYDPALHYGTARWAKKDTISARTSRRQPSAQQKSSWRGDAEVLRLERTKQLQTSSDGRQNRPQPEPTRHTGTFSASPREPVLLAVAACDDGRF